MMNRRYLIFIILMLVSLTACTNNNGHEVKSNLDDHLVVEPQYDSKAVVTEGDFIYRLVSEKSVYAEGEKVEVYAELEYIGDKSGIKIAHAASAFYFPMVEITRGYSLDFGMDQPLRYSYLKKGEPLREPLGVGGGYSSEDTQDYIDFIKSAGEAYKKEGTLPWGHYQLSGSAHFEPIYEEDQENESLRLEAKIEFTVEASENN